MGPLSFLFVEQYDAQEFLLCTLLCSIYFFAAVAAMSRLFKKSLGDMKKLVRLNAYSFFMSLPLMPFVAGFSTLSMALFTLSNFIWQRLKLIADGKDPKKFIITLSICHMIAWIALSLFHYWFSDGIMDVLLPEDAWIE